MCRHLKLSTPNTFNTMNTIGICCDHAGFALKQYVQQWLEAQGLEYKDFGTYSPECVDYPDFAHE